VPSATLITFPPSLDCELARFLLAHYRVPYQERRHAFIFNFFATLLHGCTLHFPLLYNDSYKLDTVRKMIDYFDPLCPADRNLLLAGAEHTQVESDWTLFNSTLGGATATFAYYHLLPLRDVMIRPLSEGTPAFEAFTVRVAYPVYAHVLSAALRLSESSAAAALDQIRAVAKTVDQRLADGRRYLVGDRFSLSDMSFAEALSPLVLPDNDGAPMPTFAQMPPPLQSLYTELRARPAGQFALRIYHDYRGGPP
jgi:glutathione S-transferase